MSSTLLVSAAAAVAATYVFLRAYVWLTQDPQEPQVVIGAIPFISHLIGLMTEKANYYLVLWKKYNYPIYTLRAVGARLYVVNSRQLTRKIDAHIETVAFSPIQMRVFEKAAAATPNGIVKVGSEDRLLENGWFRSFPRAVAPATMPGLALDSLNRTACDVFASSFESIAQKNGADFDLMTFVRDQFFNATTEATYGEQNPFRDAESVKAWYTFDANIMPILMDILPKVLCNSALKARELLAKSFGRYFDENGADKASSFLKMRRQHCINFGLGDEDVARTEIMHMLASMGNTTSNIYWTVWQIFSDPIVYADCQKEVLALVQIDSDGSRSIDLAQVRTKCPILVSSWEEISRFHGISISARIIQQDVIVDGKYLLKKDGVLMIPNAVLHSDPTIWGPTAEEFNHKRFVKKAKDGSYTRLAVKGFRPFGSGNVLCPGRYFVTAEILSFVALLIARFEVEPVDGGAWIYPGKDYVMNTALPSPKKKIQIHLRPRDQEEWRVLYSSGAGVVDLTADASEMVTE